MLKSAISNQDSIHALVQTAIDAAINQDSEGFEPLMIRIGNMELLEIPEFSMETSWEASILQAAAQGQVKLKDLSCIRKSDSVTRYLGVHVQNEYAVMNPWEYAIYQMEHDYRAWLNDNESSLSRTNDPAKLKCFYRMHDSEPGIEPFVFGSRMRKQGTLMTMNMAMYEDECFEASIDDAGTLLRQAIQNRATVRMIKRNKEYGKHTDWLLNLDILTLKRVIYIGNAIHEGFNHNLQREFLSALENPAYWMDLPAETAQKTYITNLARIISSEKPFSEFHKELEQSIGDEPARVLLETGLSYYQNLANLYITKGISDLRRELEERLDGHNIL